MVGWKPAYFSARTFIVRVEWYCFYGGHKKNLIFQVVLIQPEVNRKKCNDQKQKKLCAQSVLQHWIPPMMFTRCMNYLSFGSPYNSPRRSLQNISIKAIIPGFISYRFSDYPDPVRGASHGPRFGYIQKIFADLSIHHIRYTDDRANGNLQATGIHEESRSRVYEGICNI